MKTAEMGGRELDHGPTHLFEPREVQGMINASTHIAALQVLVDARGTNIVVEVIQPNHNVPILTLCFHTSTPLLLSSLFDCSSSQSLHV